MRNKIFCIYFKIWTMFVFTAIAVTILASGASAMRGVADGGIVVESVSGIVPWDGSDGIAVTDLADIGKGARKIRKRVRKQIKKMSSQIEDAIIEAVDDAVFGS